MESVLEIIAWEQRRPPTSQAVSAASAPRKRRPATPGLESLLRVRAFDRPRCRGVFRRQARNHVIPVNRAPAKSAMLVVGAIVVVQVHMRDKAPQGIEPGVER